MNTNKTKTAYVCWNESHKDEKIDAYRIFVDDELYKVYPLLYPVDDIGDGYVPAKLLDDLAILQNKGCKIQMFF